MTRTLDKLKQAVCHWIDMNADPFNQIAQNMYHQPELGLAEFKAAQWLTDSLRSHGFIVETGIADMPTAFRATWSGRSPHPRVALLCEYDALPDIGHGCGHNQIGTASVWAGAALSQLQTELPGTIVVFGTPAEETHGGKVILTNHHYFDNIDVAMIYHPGAENRVHWSTLALDALEVTFFGKTAHAAASPHLGINALDAVIQTFNGVNALRQHLQEDVRIHGIISEGGKTPNVVPDRAQARFYLRAKDRHYLNDVVSKFHRICEGASLITGATYEIRYFENSNDNLISNRVIGEYLETNLRALGVTAFEPPIEGGGSSDVGNVSQVCPTVHPFLNIGTGLVMHSQEFADATVNHEGLAMMKIAAKSLAMTTLDLLYTPGAIQDAKAELASIKQTL